MYEVHEAPPGDATTVYPVIGDPPSSAGGVRDTTVEVSPASTRRLVGAAGAAAGVALAVAVENAEAPTPFTA